MSTANRSTISGAFSLNNGNSPDSLLMSCLTFIVHREIDVRNVSLPQEICDLLLEVSLDTSDVFLASNIIACQSVV